MSLVLDQFLVELGSGETSSTPARATRGPSSKTNLHLTSPAIGPTTSQGSNEEQPRRYAGTNAKDGQERGPLQDLHQTSELIKHAELLRAPHAFERQDNDYTLTIQMLAASPRVRKSPCPTFVSCILSFAMLFTLSFLALLCVVPTSIHASTVGNVTTSDGTKLAYIQAGPAAGQQLLFIPGWRQTAAEWRKQIQYFSGAGYHVTSYDHRGHGDSEKTNSGYRISRLASDLNDLMTTLDLSNVSIIAHSMGSSVTWALWDQYPEQQSRIHRFIIDDQSSVLVQDPTWTQAQRDTWSAALFKPAQTYTFSANMSNELVPFVTSMFTKNVSESDLDWVIAQNKKMSDQHAATLLINHAFMDWRDVLPKIDIPTMVLSGAVSLNDATGINWAATQIPGAKAYTFTAEEQGSHFVFWQNPDRFNQVVRDFVTPSA